MLMDFADVQAGHLTVTTVNQRAIATARSNRKRAFGISNTAYLILSRVG